jgi:hypothetical protein
MHYNTQETHTKDALQIFCYDGRKGTLTRCLSLHIILLHSTEKNPKVNAGTGGKEIAPTGTTAPPLPDSVVKVQRAYAVRSRKGAPMRCKCCSISLNECMASVS